MSHIHRSSTAVKRSAAASDLTLSGQSLTIEQVSSAADGRPNVQITGDGAVLERMRASQDLVRQAVDDGARVYGVTTGFGSMSEVPVPGELAAASQANLLSFLATGAGRPIERQHVRAAMMLRANMLLRGVSGVRLEIVQRLVRFLNADAVPVVMRVGIDRCQR